MPPELQALAAAQGGVFLRKQALNAGFSDHEIWASVRSKLWVKLRRGAYLDAGLWEGLDDVGKYRAVVRAVVLQLDAPAVPSHQSAAVLLELPVWELDLDTVHVTRRDLHSSRIEAGVNHHAAALPESDLTQVDGVLVTNYVRTSVDIAREATFEQGVVLADAALAAIDNDKDSLLSTLDRMRDWPGARQAGRVVEFADGRSESVGESRARVQFERIGLPRPKLQVMIGDYWLDFLFEEHQTGGEFDGHSKYTQFLKPGEDPGDVVWREALLGEFARQSGGEHGLRGQLGMCQGS